MSDGHIYDLIRELIEAQARMNERPDSIEFGQASRRCKVYVNANDPEGAVKLIEAMKKLASQAVSAENPPSSNETKEV